MDEISRLGEFVEIGRQSKVTGVREEGEMENYCLIGGEFPFAVMISFGSRSWYNIAHSAT